MVSDKKIQELQADFNEKMKQSDLKIADLEKRLFELEKSMFHREWNEKMAKIVKRDKP